MPRTPKHPALWDLAQDYHSTREALDFAQTAHATAKETFEDALLAGCGGGQPAPSLTVAYNLLAADHQEPPKRQHRRKVMALPERHGHIVQGVALAPRTRPPLDLPEILQQEEEVTNEP